MKKIITLMICLLTVTLAQAQLTTLALVGSGTTQGWPVDPQTDTAQYSSTDGENWTITNVPLLNGAIKFRGNNSWALPYNWGGSAFPSGTAAVDGAGITATPGIYNGTFNSTTGVYTFTLQTNVFPVIGVIGTATAGDWGTDTDMTTTDGIHYTLTTALTAEAIKFRQDHTWTPTTNWGGDTFPSGTGTVDGAAITVAADGTYDITFNRNTLAYSFSFPTIAVVGGGTPAGWPTGALGEIDSQVMSTTDGLNYTYANMVLTSAGVKFRQGNSWTHNWGANSWPTGTGVQDGLDVPAVAGTYSIALNRITGAYGFTDLLATDSFSSRAFSVYPNPTQGVWNFTAVKEKIERISIIDVTGKTVLSVAPAANEASINASSLNSGIYFAKVTGTSSNNTIKLIKK